MKKNETIAALRKLSQCVRVELAGPLSQFADYLDKSSINSMSGLLGALNKKRANGNVPARSPVELREALRCFLAIVQACGTKASTIEAKRLLSLLPPDMNCSMEVFLDDLKSLDAKPTATRKKKPPKAPDEVLAARLATELHETKRHEVKFGAGVSKLRNTKTVDTPTLLLVAKKFLGPNVVVKGRKAAIDAIIKKHQDELRYAFQERSLEGLNK